MENIKTGVVINICEKQQIMVKGGKYVFKQVLVMDATPYNPYTGERSEYENILRFEFFGERIELLTGVKEGDIVDVKFDLRGNEWVDDKNEKHYAINVIPYGLKVRKAAKPLAEDNTPF